jgi:hypothetical protein
MGLSGYVGRVYRLRLVPGLPKMRRFDGFHAAKQEKAQTTSGNNQHTADQNQFRGHEEFLSLNLCSSHRLTCR